MWGAIEGRSKIDILRSGLIDQLSNYESRVELALLAFGQRRKSDCRDVEVLQPVGPLDAATIAGRLWGINPRGRAPMAVALEIAAAELGSVGSGLWQAAESDHPDVGRGDGAPWVREPTPAPRQSKLRSRAKRRRGK